MRKVLACVLSLVVGLALFQLAGCKKSEPAAKPGQPGAAAKSDPLAATAKKLVGAWKGKPTPKETGKKGGPEKEMPVTVEFKGGGAMTLDAAIFTMNGTWEVLKAEGNNVTIKAVMEMPDLGAMMGKEKEAKPTKEAKDFLIVFLNDDRITMAPADDPKDIATLDRQKK